MIGLPGVATKDCQRCSLRQGCSQVVWGQGGASGGVLIVGEHPGTEEDLLGEPFTGREGRLLRRLMREAELPLDRVRLTYAVKCLTAKQPAVGQINSCRVHLQEEIDEYCPSVLVTLGRVATRQALGLKQTFNFVGTIGVFHTVPYLVGYVAPWYSPSSILQGGKAADKLTVAFFRQVMEKVC